MSAPQPRSEAALLWLSAAAIVLAAHAGLVVWSLRQPPRLAGDTPAQQAVMIDLEPEPELPPEPAPEIAQEIAPDLAEALPDMTAPPMPEPAIEPMAEAMPTPPDTPTLTDPLPVAELPPMPPSEVVLPKPRVTPPPPRPAQKQIAKVRTEAPKPPKPVAAQPRQVASKAAREGSRETVSSTKWQSRLLAHIERRKRYPSAARSRREEGTVHARFRIDEAGNVLSVRIARSSGFPELDAAVVALIRNASPVPPPPAGAPREITAPVAFQIR